MTDEELKIEVFDLSMQMLECMEGSGPQVVGLALGVVLASFVRSLTTDKDVAADGISAIANDAIDCIAKANDRRGPVH